MLDERIAHELLNATRAVSKNAYAPYSQFPVGAAILTLDDQIVAGVNVENTSYGLTICAERAAVFQAVTQGHTKFKAIALWAEKMPLGSTTPCGACRQVLAEFMGSDAWIIMPHPEKEGELRQLALATLLPEMFFVQTR